MIYFRACRWSNFLSTGNQFTEIILNKSASTLIVGENGAGKSTLLDALSFGMYGRPYRNINKPLLVNTITNKNCMVEIEFSVGKKQYKVIRGIKPNIFEIYVDGKLLDQNASVKEYQDYLEKNILKLNHKSFTQIMVVGSANFTPFMQLRPFDRRKVIEDLLDIEIFSKMFLLLREKINKNKDELTETKYQIELLEQKIKLTKKHINEIMSMKKSDKEAKEKRISVIKKELDSLLVEIDGLQEKADTLSKKIADQSDVQNKLVQLDKYESKLGHRISVLNKEIDFLHSNDECPTCQQFIETDYKNERIQVKDLKKKEIDDGLRQLRDKYGQLNERMTKINEVQEQLSNVNTEILDRNTNMKVLRSQIHEIKAQLKAGDKDIGNTDEALKELDKADGKKKYQSRKHKKLTERHALYDKAQALLKDGGIKTRIIKQYIPVINKLMNKYLAALDFFVQFELDENFNEKIKSRFRDEFTYNSFSEGEKMRIDLALLFTWRAVAKLRNSASTNLLILDEVFDSSLDMAGTDEFLKIINQLSKDANVFVISHKGDQLFDKFADTIRFAKVKNFSHIVE
jgi:DNA repair exonuclease SbcCD ATPase subunit